MVIVILGLVGMFILRPLWIRVIYRRRRDEPKPNGSVGETETDRDTESFSGAFVSDFLIKTLRVFGGPG